MENPLRELSAPIGGVSWTGKSLRCNRSDVLGFFPCSPPWLGWSCFIWKDTPAPPPRPVWMEEKL